MTSSALKGTCKRSVCGTLNEILGVKSSSALETKAIGQRLGSLLHGGDVVLLIGDLGMGKTAFTSGIAVGMGISQRVASPTFVMVREYFGSFRLVHCDLYRIDTTRGVDFDDLELFDEDSVTVVEWADLCLWQFDDFDPLVILFANGADEDSRSITFTENNSRWNERFLKF